MLFRLHICHKTHLSESFYWKREIVVERHGAVSSARHANGNCHGLLEGPGSITDRYIRYNVESRYPPPLPSLSFQISLTFLHSIRTSLFLYYIPLSSFKSHLKNFICIYLPPDLCKQVSIHHHPTYFVNNGPHLSRVQPSDSQPPPSRRQTQCCHQQLQMKVIPLQECFVVQNP
jgi:hypothetical protein